MLRIQSSGGALRRKSIGLYVGTGATIRVPSRVIVMTTVACGAATVPSPIVGAVSV
jgi:hypothetical protein